MPVNVRTAPTPPTTTPPPLAARIEPSAIRSVTVMIVAAGESASEKGVPGNGSRPGVSSVKKKPLGAAIRGGVRGSTTLSTFTRASSVAERTGVPASAASTRKK